MPKTEIMRTKKVNSNDGGCWFCHKKDNNMLFDSEFDTFVHADCIRTCLKSHAEKKEYPEGCECAVMSYLLEEYQ